MGFATRLVFYLDGSTSMSLFDYLIESYVSKAVTVSVVTVTVEILLF